MEKYVPLAPVVMEGFPDAHNVFLQVRNQRFTIGYAAETKQEAEWVRDMLCIALARIAADATGVEEYADMD